MKDFVRKHKILLLVVLVIIILSIIIINMLSTLNIRGYLTGFIVADENGGHTVYDPADIFLSYSYQLFDMTKEEAEEVIKYPENYTAYWIGINIHNNADYAIHYIKACLSCDINNFWLDTSSLSEGPLTLIAGQEYKDTNILVIVKTENLSNEEIEELIKSIGITISARTVEWLPIYTSKTIYFEK